MEESSLGSSAYLIISFDVFFVFFVYLISVRCAAMTVFILYFIHHAFGSLVTESVVAVLMNLLCTTHFTKLVCISVEFRFSEGILEDRDVFVSQYIWFKSQIGSVCVRVCVRACV